MHCCQRKTQVIIPSGRPADRMALTRKKPEKCTVGRGKRAPQVQAFSSMQPIAWCAQSLRLASRSAVGELALHRRQISAPSWQKKYHWSCVESFPGDEKP